MDWSKIVIDKWRNLADFPMSMIFAVKILIIFSMHNSTSVL